MKSRSKFDRRSLVVEGLEERRVLAASVGWDGPGQGSADLTYYIGQAPNGMSQSTFEAAIESALKAWSDVADVNFTQTTQAGLNNSLDFTAQAIDGSGRTLAQAYFPSDSNRSRIAGDVQFDSAESWEVGNSRGASAFDLVFVAVHEIGHALGLDHSSDATAILYPSVSPTQSFVGLDADDISAIRSLYAAEPGSTSTTGTNTETSSNSGTGTTRPPTWQVPTRTTQYTNNSWFANFYRRFGGFRGGLESLDADTPVNHNLFNPLDVNTDSTVSPADALLVINVLKDNGKLTTEIKVDTNGDGQISPLDALLVINGIGDQQSTTTITINLSGDSPVVSVVTTPIDDSSTDDPVDDSSGDDTSNVDDTSDTGSGSGNDDSGTDDNGTDDSGTDDSGADDNGTDHSDTGTDTNNDSDSDTDSDEDTDVSFDDFGHRHRHRFAGFGLGPGFGPLVPNRVDAIFERFDDNADELLTEDEVPSGLWDHWMDANVDANDDASINVAELNAAVLAKQRSQFDALDDDSDGMLTEDEVTSRLWTKLTDAEADTDADGGISFEELLAFQESATGFGRGNCDNDDEEDSDDDSSSDTDDDSTTTTITIATTNSRSASNAPASSITLNLGRTFEANTLVKMAAALRSMGRRFQ